MNTREIVKLTTDTGYIPVKYAVIEVSIGSTLANSYAWIKCIANGVATEANFNALKASVDNYESPNSSLVLGTLGMYSVVALSNIVPYSAPKKYDMGGLLLG